MATQETHISQAINQDRNRKTIYSFGEDGLTASVSPSGRLLQITQYFVNERTAFCVNPSDIPEPFYVVDRISDLFDLASDSSTGVGIGPELKLSEAGRELPSLEFIHDRWPCFTTSADGIKVKIQYIAVGNTVFQTFNFEFESNESIARNGDPSELSITSDLLIRDIDFIDPSNRFNEKGLDHEDYPPWGPEETYCIIREHKRVSEDELKYTVALFVSAFSETETLKFSKDNGEYKIRWKEASNNPQNPRSRIITLAYTLKVLPKGSSSGPSPVSIEDVRDARELLEQPYAKPPTFTSHSDLDFVLRRNLEHILSVCSIPVTQPDERGIPAIALTCGDIDCHRVATAASFYSFQFLLQAFKNLDSEERDCKCATQKAECKSYVSKMKARILRVCKGHLRWTFQETEKPNGLFSPHYWVNGKSISDWENNEFLSEKTLVGAPFHIIKAGDFHHVTGGLDWATDLKDVEDAVEAWVKDLDKTNKLGLYAFPRTRKEPTHNFYFTDHAMIWRAIKSAENLGLRSDVYIPIDVVNGNRVRLDKKIRNPRIYSSSQIQNNILKRFTTENPLSNKRMIAVSRSPAHNRFLLRSKDAALFHIMELGLFDKPGTEQGDTIWQNKIDIWRNTIDCQIYHEDNDDTAWDEPLRFALSIIMASTGKRMNLRPMDEMHERALSVLLQSASPDGLIPAQLDENNEPLMYDNEPMRDTYWGITFEIPYLLWKHVSLSLMETHQTQMTTAAIPARVSSNDSRFQSPSDAEFWKSLKEALEQQMGTKGFANPMRYSMKVAFPLNNVIDQQNIIEISDEWLYNEPAFFPPASKKTTPEDNIGSSGDSARDSEIRICVSPDMTPEPVVSQIETLGALYDVPKSKMRKKRSMADRSRMRVVSEEQDIKTIMEERRTPAIAKKRFWIFCSLSLSAIKSCCVTSTEREEVTAFFKRHESGHKYFFEDTAPVLNRWTTDLHLSFYSIDRRESTDRFTLKDIRNTELLMFPGDGENAKQKRLTRVAMSFRFDGDFFDRYWTSFYLERDLRVDSPEGQMLDEIDELLNTGTKVNDTDLKKAPWRQRRVLELLLFDRILSTMNKRTEEILKEVKSDVWKKTSTGRFVGVGQSTEDESEEAPYDTFLITSSRCQKFQQILQAVEADLAENVAKIDSWLNREKERETEKPRWTFNDESRYRGIISKLLVQNDHQIQELRRSHASISSFNESLMKKLEIMRSDLEQRRADDIQRFTYVTVVFLPIGFATGIFSMGQAPTSVTLVSMIVTAAVSLLITALLVTQAKNVERLYYYASEHLMGKRRQRHDSWWHGAKEWVNQRTAKKSESIGDEETGNESYRLSTEDEESEYRMANEGSRSSREDRIEGFRMRKLQRRNGFNT